jgi:RimJ/RimL family protein N-acetyltransferase
MKWIVADHTKELGAWASQRIQYSEYWGDFRAIGLVDEKEILAVVIYNDFYETGCAIHIAAIPGRKWLTKEFLFAAFDYPFNQLKLKRLTGYVASRNLEAQRLDEHLGFKREGYLRDMLPDDNVILYGMLRSECRWLRSKENRRQITDSCIA